MEGKITFLINIDGTIIELHDPKSGVTFLTIKLTPAELSSALSRLGYTPCTFNMKGIDLVGKTMEMKTHSFKVSSGLIYRGKLQTEELSRLAKESMGDLINEGWVSDDYFNSKNTFKRIDDDTYLCNVTIRRWV